uniref:Uncharacterized protein n=1 Tax=Arundo donax TaxID=35708 RepID=A0A0A9BFD2_ARUDO
MLIYMYAYASLDISNLRVMPPEDLLIYYPPIFEKLLQTYNFASKIVICKGEHPG